MTTQTTDTSKLPDVDDSWNQHVDERNLNKEAWIKKPRLREEYARLYIQMRDQMVAPDTLEVAKPLSIEIGSGMGNIKTWIPEVLTSERDPSPDVDRQECAYNLSFQDGTLSNILAMDVWHHLECPQAALKEWRRALADGGRVILMEPGPGSILGNLVYGLAHHEPVGWNTKFLSLGEWDPTQENYFACQSSATRHFIKKEFPELLKGWKVEAKKIPALAYLTTGGFSKPVLGPEWLTSLIRKMEKPAQLVPWLTTTRVIVTLEKLPD